MINEPDSGTTVIQIDAKSKPKRGWQDILVGRPLSSQEEAGQTIGKFIGLAVFSSDAMSSVAYGPQEMMFMLYVAGTSALHLALPIVFAIVGLLAILIFSYTQTIHAYPGGGGAYIVARDNLGELPAQTAGAALLTDYILTVAVSISSGVAQIVSAFPVLYPHRVIIAVSFIFIIMLINLRGVKEAGVAFAIPTYYFLVLIFITVIIGLARYLTGSLGVLPPAPALEPSILQPVTIFLILKAFANGTTSLTGVEAISNGITAFKEPRSKNAATTLVIMALILGSLLVGITFLSLKVGAIPSEGETIISQLVRIIYNGRGIMYLLTISATTLILVMAANTAFAGFPRLGALVAQDGFLPRQLTLRGSRLVYSKGIILLAAVAAFLVIGFRASVSGLIPLYAIGVFLSFTLSQTGMAVRWFKSGRLQAGQQVKERGSTLIYERSWLFRMVVNSVGAISTAIVAVIFAVTKFSDGAWVVILLLPILIAFFYTIHHHYKGLARQLSLDNNPPNKFLKRNRVIMPVSGVHTGTLAALEYARSLSDDITAVHVSMDAAETERVKEKWETWGDGYRLVVLNSPYRLFLVPLLNYIDELIEIQKQNEVITIVVPQFVPKQWWTGFLHMRTAETLRKVLLNRKNIVITEVPYQVE